MFRPFPRITNDAARIPDDNTIIWYLSLHTGIRTYDAILADFRPAQQGNSSTDK